MDKIKGISFLVIARYFIMMSLKLQMMRGKK